MEALVNIKQLYLTFSGTRKKAAFGHVAALKNGEHYDMGDDRCHSKPSRKIKPYSAIQT